MAYESSSVVALQDAIKRAGSQTAFAVLAGVTQQAVSKWLKKRRPLPAELVLTVEAATGVSRYDLRPDIYQRDEPTTPAPQPGARA